MIMDLLLQSAFSRGCLSRFCSDTASSTGHKCHSLQETANDPASQGSTHLLLLPYLPHPTTHQHALPPLHPLSVGNKPGLIHGVITCTQLRLIRDNWQEGGVHLVNPKQADSTYHPIGNPHLTSHTPLANPCAI